MSSFGKEGRFTEGPQEPRDGRSRKPRPLSRRIWHLLRQGDRRDRYDQDRSRLLIGIVLGAVNRNWPRRKIFGALLDPCNLGGAKLQEKREQQGEREARRYFDMLYQKALQRWLDCPPTRRDPTRARRFFRRLRTSIEISTWSGARGASACSVLLAHVEIAESVGNRTYTASVRQVAERADLHHRTVIRIHPQLCEAGWLRRRERGEGREATRWTLHRPETVRSLRHALARKKKRPYGGAAGYTAPERDAFRWGGLGKSTGRVFQAIERLGRVSITGLARATHLTPRQVRYHLNKLTPRRLVRRRAGRIERGDADLARVAAQLGTLGAGAVQQAKNEQERCAYRLHRLRLHLLALARARRWPALQLEPKVSVVGGERAWRQFVLGVDKPQLHRIRGLLRNGRGAQAVEDAPQTARGT